jgi:hypothetical protein
MHTGKTYSSVSVLCITALCAAEMPGNAQDHPGSAEKQDAETASSHESKGLLPIPDYSGDLWTRQYLSGDWRGVRTNLANKGLQFGVEWNQYVQGVVDGGRDRTTVYGGTTR